MKSETSTVTKLRLSYTYRMLRVKLKKLFRKGLKEEEALGETIVTKRRGGLKLQRREMGLGQLYFKYYFSVSYFFVLLTVYYNAIYFNNLYFGL